jgi:hypothetical protein
MHPSVCVQPDICTSEHRARQTRVLARRLQGLWRRKTNVFRRSTGSRNKRNKSCPPVWICEVDCDLSFELLGVIVDIWIHRCPITNRLHCVENGNLFAGRCVCIPCRALSPKLSDRCAVQGVCTAKRHSSTSHVLVLFPPMCALPLANLSATARNHALLKRNPRNAREYKSNEVLPLQKEDPPGVQVFV